MSNNLRDILEHPPVQVKCEAMNEDSQWKMYVGIYVASDGKMRIDLESRRIENGEIVEHGAFLCLPPITYQVDLLANTFKVMDGAVGFDFDSMGVEVMEVVHEEPDPHLFLITADLRPE